LQTRFNPLQKRFNPLQKRINPVEERIDHRLDFQKKPAARSAAAEARSAERPRV
jgi:hypothetical protein